MAVSIDTRIFAHARLGVAIIRESFLQLVHSLQPSQRPKQSSRLSSGVAYMCARANVDDFLY